MRPAEDMRKLVENLNDKTSAEMDERVLGDVMQALDETKTTESASNRPKIWKTIMRNPITRVAAAAVIFVAVLIVMNQFGGSTGNVVWGEVVRNIEASPGFIYRMKQTHNDKETGIREYHMMVYGSAQYGMRMDSYIDPEFTIQTYATLSDRAMTSVDHTSRTYYRTALADDTVAELENMNPKAAVTEYLSAEYTKLGRKTIEGIEAEGIEIDKDPSEAKANFQVDSCIIQLWVAVDTGLPILVEVDTVGKNGTLKIHTIQDNFQWNVKLDASEFEPNIPEDYTQKDLEIDAEGKVSYKTTVKYDSQELTGAKIHKWRFRDKHPEQGYRLVSEDGQAATNIPESWADSPEQAVRIKEEMDLQRQQGNRELVAVTEIEVNGQLDHRVLRYEHNLSDGQTVRISDFDPDDPSEWTLVGERREELNQLFRERRRQEEQGQKLATTEERQVHGLVFVFKNQQFVLSDGTKVVYSIGRLKDE